MELDDAAAAQKLHASRVAQALVQGSRVHEEMLPERPMRGLALGILVAVLVTVIVGVVGVVYTAFTEGNGLNGGRTGRTAVGAPLEHPASPTAEQATATTPPRHQ